VNNSRFAAQSTQSHGVSYGAVASPRRDHQNDLSSHVVLFEFTFLIWLVNELSCEIMGDIREFELGALSALPRVGAKVFSLFVMMVFCWLGVSKRSTFHSLFSAYKLVVEQAEWVQEIPSRDVRRVNRNGHAVHDNRCRLLRHPAHLNSNLGPDIWHLLHKIVHYSRHA
jgi:hypothetical protein